MRGTTWCSPSSVYKRIAANGASASSPPCGGRTDRAPCPGNCASPRALPGCYAIRAVPRTRRHSSSRSTTGSPRGLNGHKGSPRLVRWRGIGANIYCGRRSSIRVPIRPLAVRPCYRALWASSVMGRRWEGPESARFSPVAACAGTHVPLFPVRSRWWLRCRDGGRFAGGDRHAAAARTLLGPRCGNKCGSRSIRF